jgi:hypothetical protein
MRRSALAGALALVLTSTPAWAQERSLRAATPPVPIQKKVESAAETDAMAKAAQQRNDAQQNAWDRKMKAITGTICTGC